MPYGTGRRQRSAGHNAASPSRAYTDSQVNGIEDDAASASLGGSQLWAHVIERACELCDGMACVGGGTSLPRVLARRMLSVTRLTKFVHRMVAALQIRLLW
jgi:hypothetical protein